MNSHDDDDDQDEPGFFQRNRVVVIVVGLLLVGGGVSLVAKALSGGKSAPSKAAEPNIVQIKLPPVPPPPPPPPPPPMKQEEKMIEQDVVKDEPPPEETPQEAPIATSIPSSGAPDAFGIPGGRSGSRIGGTSGRRSGKWDRYASQVQNRIADALRKNDRTKNASLSMQVRVWPDSTGRITRAQLATSSGDAQVDEAIRSEVLTGLQLQEPPPAGMPSPIVLRLSARRN